MTSATREDIVNFYSMYLGRHPESEAAATDRIGQDREILRAAFYHSKEHQIKSAEANVDIVFVGNCQARMHAEILNKCSSLNCKSIFLTPKRADAVVSGREYVSHWLTSAKTIYCTQVSDSMRQTLSSLFYLPESKIKQLPSINSSALHPDMMYVYNSKNLNINDYNSRIVLFSFLLDLSQEKCLASFNKTTFEDLGYFDKVEEDRAYFSQETMTSGFPMSALYNKWMARRCKFMHSMNHPVLSSIADLSFEVAKRAGVYFNTGKADYVFDSTSVDPSWNVYPEIAQKLGYSSDYYFKLLNRTAEENGDRPLEKFHVEQRQGMDLKAFIDWQYQLFSRYGKNDILLSEQEKKNLEVFRKSIAPKESQARIAKNPYLGLKSHQFWKRSISSVAPELVDPITSTRFTIGKEDRVATAGSCFAQHISRTLSKNGFNYFVTESNTDQNALERNYGVYSARYGNVYSTRQLLQLLERAYGRFEPQEEAWLRPDGRYADPYRPQIEPEGFASLEELRASRDEHLAAVREMFEKSSIFVFTLGLTEIWRNRADGAVFPLAPGVAAGTWDPQAHEFINLSYEEVRSDLQTSIDLLRAINPGLRIILTVSPVALMATYEQRHVLCSTILSKSILRAVADDIQTNNLHVDYFPSFEIITGSHAAGSSFEDDLRSVRPEAVAGVMRLFMKHYAQNAEVDEPVVNHQIAKTQAALRLANASAAVVCEEEALDL